MLANMLPSWQQASPAVQPHLNRHKQQKHRHFSLLFLEYAPPILHLPFIVPVAQHSYNPQTFTVPTISHVYQHIL